MKGLPTTYLQEEWVRAVGPESNNNIPQAVTITGPVDVERIAAALRRVVTRQEQARVHFEWDAHPMTVASHDEPDFELPVLDLSDLDSQAAQERWRSEAVKLASIPVRLDTGPLWRALYVVLPGDQSVLVTSWHHAIFDGWSNTVLFRELVWALGDRSNPPALAAQAADYAAVERATRLDSEGHGFWRRTLSADRADFRVDEGEGDFVMRASALGGLSAGHVARLGELGGIDRASSVLRALVIFSLGQYLGSSVTIGCVYANRDHPALAGLIGLFSDQLPVRVELDADPDISTLSRRVDAAVRESRWHQARLGTLRSELGEVYGRSGLGGQPFDISINYMPQPAATRKVVAQAGDLRLESTPVDSTGVDPVIHHPFSGGVLMGYQLRHDPRAGVGGDLWARSPAVASDLRERLAMLPGALPSTS